MISILLLFTSRDLGDQYWMKCKVYIDIGVVKSGPIPYKYVVYSANRKDANEFEFFHDSPKKITTDRCLAVPCEECKPKGMNHAVYYPTLVQ